MSNTKEEAIKKRAIIAFITATSVYELNELTSKDLKVKYPDLTEELYTAVKEEMFQHMIHPHKCVITNSYSKFHDAPVYKSTKTPYHCVAIENVDIEEYRKQKQEVEERTSVQNNDNLKSKAIAAFLAEKG